MAATLPRPSRPSMGPPTTALPALPAQKTRKSTNALATTPGPRSDSLPIPKSGLRVPSSSRSTPTTPLPSSGLPRPDGFDDAGKTVRRTISINAFPQPPRGGVRRTSLPPSPLSGGFTPPSATPKNDSSDMGSAPGASRLRQRSNVGLHQSFLGASSASGSGDNRFISSAVGATGSDGLLSLPSPPQSRSSSTQDSYSTSATVDETGESVKGAAQGTESHKRASKPAEGKGNVIVSVRVRPDAGVNGDSSKTEGEWMVDGRQSLVAYRGREGGDYIFGMCQAFMSRIFR